MSQAANQTAYTDILALSFAGKRADCTYAHEIVPAFNTESSAEIAFGLGVARDNTSPYAATGVGAKLPAATTDKLLGITVFSHSYSLNPNNLELGTTGMKAGVLMNVMRHGRIWAIAELGAAGGDRLFVRCTSAGSGKGSLLNSDPGSSTVVATTGKIGEWCTAASALGLAIVEVMFVNA